LRTLITQFAKK